MHCVNIFLNHKKEIENDPAVDFLIFNTQNNMAIM